MESLSQNQEAALPSKEEARELVQSKTKGELNDLFKDIFEGDVFKNFLSKILLLFGIKIPEEEKTPDTNPENHDASLNNPTPNTPSSPEKAPAKGNEYVFPDGLTIKNSLSEQLPVDLVQRLHFGLKKHREVYKHTGHSYIVDPITMDAYVISPQNVITKKTRVSLGKGFGNVPGSNHTPVGTLRVVERDGANTTPGQKIAGRKVWTRVLILEGRDPGIQNSMTRGIQFHAIDPTKKDMLGSMGGSSGCIVTSNEDIIDLYNTLPNGSHIEVLPKIFPSTVTATLPQVKTG